METTVKKEVPGPSPLVGDLRRLTGLGGIDQENPARRELRLIFTTARLENDFAHHR